MSSLIGGLFEMPITRHVQGAKWDEYETIMRWGVALGEEIVIFHDRAKAIEAMIEYAEYWDTFCPELPA